MKLNKKILTRSLLCLGISSNVSAGHVISEYAVDLAAASYTSSSFYAGTPLDTAESVFNGGVWNKGDYGWGWIQADMGTTQTLTQLKLTTAQSPNDITQHYIFLTDTVFSDYDYLTTTSLSTFPTSSTVNPIYSHTGYTVHGTVLDITLSTPQAGRYLKVFTHNGSSWSALGTPGRTDWSQTPANIQPSPSGSVPEPATYAIFALGLAGIHLSNKKRKNNNSK